MPRPKNSPIPPEIVEHISYDPETGLCIWSAPTRLGMSVGDPAGYFDDSTGYYCVHFKKRKYKLHRVVWFIYHRQDPGDYEIDHIDGDPTNNRMSNMRLCTRQMNNHNTSSRNVSFDKKAKSKPWRSFIMVDYKQIHLGCFATEEEAHTAYIEAKNRYHPTALRHK